MLRNSGLQIFFVISFSRLVFIVETERLFLFVMVFIVWYGLVISYNRKFTVATRSAW